MQKIRQFFSGISLKQMALMLLGTAILSFGIYNIHQQTHITEGGVLGMILFVNHWTGLPSSIISPILDLLCYAFAFRYLGKQFIKTSIISTVSLSACFRVWECFPPMLPDLSSHPLLAAILGGTFVGVGVGIIVKQGGSSCGDDALALSISKITGKRIAQAYMFTDFTVLALSLTYIPVIKILFSLITVTLSSWIIDQIQNVELRDWFVRVKMRV